MLDQAEQNLPENLADRYLSQAEKLIAERKYKAATDLVQKLIDLQRKHDLKYPDEFHFVYARAALSVDMIKAAMNSANQYLSAAGTSGKYYREAQELLNEAERMLPLEPEMVVIPEGRFRMGCLSCKYDDPGDEEPVHEVRVASFELSKYEVTFEEYDRFTAATGRKRADDEGWGRGRRPVINVSWHDAVAYTEWLSAKAGKSYRLPSEAEWEYAARAGAETEYHFGNDKSQLCRYANHADTSTGYSWGNTGCSDGVGKRTATVGSYQPNAFGLHDMFGNVAEWIQDCRNWGYQGAPTDGSAWTSGMCDRRVLRGGSWSDSPGYLRAADRGRNTDDGARLNYSGFRVARTLTP